tara:strand:+ start:346 stop:864 length:519 start_codon:yes stop_codon:yes gene_type:complete
MGRYTPGRGIFEGGVTFGKRETDTGSRDTHIIRGIVAGGSPFLISGSCVITGSLDEPTVLDLQRGESSGPHLRMTYTSGSAYTDLKVGSGGDLTITPTGGDLSIVGNISPSADNTYDLGSASKRWRNIYTGDLHLKNEKGDWTIVEDTEYLCLVNNLTKKRYKFVLEELPDE